MRTISATLSLLLVATSMVACAPPPAKTIQVFAASVGTTTDSVENAFTGANALLEDRKRIEDAAIYAAGTRRGADGLVAVDLNPASVSIPSELVQPRFEALAAIREYADLLTSLSGPTLTAGFSQEIAGLGTDITNLQATAATVKEGYEAFDAGPVLETFDTFGQALIEAKAGTAVTEVAPRVHPALEGLVEALIADMGSLANLNDPTKAASAVTSLLEMTPADVAPASRYTLYRDYAEILNATNGLDTGTIRTRRALKAMLRAHAKLAAPTAPDTEAVVDRFAKLANSAADFFDTL